MCGISGIMYFNKKIFVKKKYLDEMNDILSHRGPDGKGRYDKDKSGNLARIKPDLVRKTLIKARKEISNL